MKKKILASAIILATLGIASAVYLYIFVINKPHPDYEKMDPEYVMLASDLFDSYRTYRADSEEKFNGRVIQLNGTFDRIEQNDSLLVGVFVFDQGIFGEEGVRCTMLASQNGTVNKKLEGKEVRVKGFVTGYNDTDVILEKCSLIN